MAFTYRMSQSTLSRLSKIGRGHCICGHDFHVGEQVVSKRGRSKASRLGFWPKCMGCGTRYNIVETSSPGGDGVTGSETSLGRNHP